MIKPIIVTGTARLVALLVVVAFALGHAAGLLTPLSTGGLAYILTLVALLAVPKVRRGDVASGVVALLTIGAFVAAVDRGITDVVSWVVALAGVGAAVLPIELASWRMRTARNPYRGMAERRRASAHGSTYVPTAPATVTITLLQEAQPRTATPAILIVS